MDTSINSALFAGGDLVSLTSSLQRAGPVSQCNGIYDCSRQICEAYSNENVSFVGIRVWDYYDGNNSVCPFSYNTAITDAVKYDGSVLFYSSLIALYSSLFVELFVISLILYFKRFTAAWWSSNALLILSWILYGAYILKHEHDSGDYMPSYLRTFTILNAILSLVLSILGKYLALYLRSSEYTPL